MRRKTAEAAPVPVEVVAEPRTASVIADELAAARATLSAQESAVQAVRADYEAALDVGREAALAARQALTEAKIDRDVARRQVDRLDAEHGLALEGERRAELDRVVAAADGARVEYEGAVRELLPEMTRVARGLVRLWAQAQLAEDAALAAIRADAGDDAARQRQGVEAFRTWPGRPRELLAPAVERVLWTNAAGAAPGEEWQSRTREQPDGTGVLLGNGGRTTFEHRRMFREEVFLPAEPGRVADMLVKTLNVPGVTAADRAGWSPLDFADPRRALAVLDELEQPSPLAEDRRQPVTETNSVGIAVRVSRTMVPDREIGGRAA